MRKNRIFWIFVMSSIILSLLSLFTACGSVTQSPVRVAPTAPKIPAGENLYVLDGTTTNNTIVQQMIAFHPGSPTSAQMTLPVGLFSQDHKKIYTATPQNNQTRITVTNALTGSPLRSFVIPGTYTTAGQTYTTSVLTNDGKWLVLRQSEQIEDKVSIALVDTQAGKLVKAISLASNFYLDAVSPQGEYIFLIQYLTDQPGRYYVRAYDIKKDQLVKQVIADKANLNDPRMTGTALTRQMAKDGQQAYTLYIDTARNIAFIHMLPLVQDSTNPPFFALCLNLPVGRSGDLLRYYTLALSDDGKTLYAANGALGLISQVSLSSIIFSDQITSQISFDPGDVRAATNKPILYNGAALSPDQKTLYLVGVRGIRAFSTSDIEFSRPRIQGSYLTQQSVTGIATSANGRTLYAVYPSNGLTLIDVASGRFQQVTPSPAHTPWGIAWVTGK